MTVEVLTQQIVNCTTGEVTIVPLTVEEIADRELRATESLARENALKAEQDRIADLKTSARTKLVAGQPLTEEEASVLVI